MHQIVHYHIPQFWDDEYKKLEPSKQPSLFSYIIDTLAKPQEQIAEMFSKNLNIPDISFFFLFRSVCL